MNYDPNTVQWQRGDVVIHDADAKTSAMLMVVTGYDREGLCVTRYRDPAQVPSQPRGVYHNEMRFLHAPQRFGIVV